MDKHHIDVHGFEPLFEFDAHDAGVRRGVETGMQLVLAR